MEMKMEMKMKMMALERAARREEAYMHTHFPACEGAKAGLDCGNSTRMEKICCCRLDHIHTYKHAERGGAKQNCSWRR
jgi:hypothetical protein